MSRRKRRVIKSYPKELRAQRESDMVSRHLAGETLTAIGESYGISRERVRQIVRHAGIEPEESKMVRACATVARRMKRCIVCDNEFESKTKSTNHCSVECGRVTHHARICKSDDDLLQILRDLALELGHTPGANHINRMTSVAHTTYYNRFGSLRRAQEMAGLPANRVGTPVATDIDGRRAEVLRHVLEKRSYAEIASEMDISRHTVWNDVKYLRANGVSV